MMEHEAQMTGRSRKGKTIREVHLRDYFRVAWRGRWTVAAVAVAVFTISLVATLLATPVFRATATVEIQPQGRSLMKGDNLTGLGVQGFSWTAEDRYLKTQLKIIRSRGLASEIVAEQHLDQDPRFPQAGDPVETLMSMISVKPVEGTGIVEIGIAGPDPEAITHWANAVADRFVQRNVDEARGQVEAVVQDVYANLDRLREDMEAAQEKSLARAREGGILVPGTESQLEQEYGRLGQEHARARESVSELAREIEAVNGLLEGRGDPMQIEDITRDQTVQSLTGKKVDAVKKLDGLALTLKPGHPEFQTARTELDSLNARLDDQYRAILERKRRDYETAIDREKFYARELDRVRRQAQQFGEISTGYQIAESDAEARKKVYDAVVQRLEEINLSSQILANNIRILDYAIVPNAPFAPRRALNLAAGLLLGLILGLGTVFFLDYLDNTIKSADDVEHDLDLSLLALVPRRRAQDSQAVKEAYQTLRTSVLFSSQGRTLNTLLFTSAGPREGKSTSVAELAQTLASAGETVLLMDCDLRRPTVHTRFGLPRDHGLSNYLAARELEDWKDYVKPGSVEGLSLLTCGPIPPNPPDLFNSKRFHDLLAELKGAFDWVLIDSPPVISLTDAVILGSLVDMVAFVVKHNENDKDMIQRCLQQVRDVNPHVIGAVLNGVDLGRGGSGYYYAGYYYQSDDKTKRKRRRTKAGGAEGAGEGEGGQTGSG